MLFIIGMVSGLGGDLKPLMGLSTEEIAALPYFNYMIPMLVCAIAIMIAALVTMIVLLRKISLWSKNGEKQELLKEEREDQ